MTIPNKAPREPLTANGRGASRDEQATGARHVPMAPGHRSPDGMARPRILIVDDDHARHEQLRAMLAGGVHEAPRASSDIPRIETVDDDSSDSAYHEEQAIDLVRQAAASARPYAIAFVVHGRMAAQRGDRLALIRRLWQADERLEIVLCLAHGGVSWEEIVERIGESDQLVILQPPFEMAGVRQVTRTLWKKWLVTRSDERRVGHLEQIVATRTVELEETHGQLCREIAERTRVEDELRRAQRLHALGRMAAGLSHEINNPLSFVMQSVEAAQTEFAAFAQRIDDPALPSIGRLLEIALVGADRIRRIIRNIKLVSHPVDSTAESCDIAAAMQLAIDMVRSNIDDHIQILAEIESVPAVWCKRVEMEQVFVNLLSNAAHALAGTHEAHAHIRVRLRREDEWAVADIADTGVGIPKQYLDKIFDPFFTTKPAGQGTGLGLAVCHAIIAGIGGDIRVTSESGQGSVFTVRLPCVDFADDPVHTSAPRETGPLDETRASGRVHVLVVDDEPLIRRVIKHALGTYEVVEASDGHEALAHCMSQTFDVILCDIMMPNMNGMEFYEKLEELLPGAEDDIIFFTAGSRMEEVHDFLERVPNDCLEKPIERRRLQQYIADIVQRSRQRSMKRA